MAVDAYSLINEALFRTKQTRSGPQFTARSDVLQLLNNMLVDLTHNTDVLLKTDSITLVSGTRSYTLPADLYKIAWVSYDNEPLSPVTVDELDRYSSTWRDDSGDVTHFMRGYEGYDKLTLYETPGASDDGQAATIGYIYYPAALTDSTSSTLPAPISNNRQLALDWLLWQILSLRTENEDQSKATQHAQLYLVQRNQLAQMAQEHPRVYIYGSLPSRKRHRLGPSLPSTYPEV